MPSSTPAPDRPHAAPTVEIYGLNCKRRARLVVAFLLSRGVVAQSIFRIDGTGRVLGARDRVTGGVVYLRIRRWDPIRAEWSRSPLFFNRNLRSQATKALRDIVTPIRKPPMTVEMPIPKHARTPPPAS